MRIWAAAVFVIVAFSGQTQRSTKAIGTSAIATIPFREKAGHICVRGTISGFGALSIVIDTGVPESLLSQTIYERLKLPLTGMVNLAPGYGGRVTNPMVKTSVPSIDLGGLAVKNLAFIVIPPDYIPTMPGVEIDGILGSELFDRYVVEIDYSDKVLRFYDPTTYRKPRGGCKLPLLHRGPMPSALPLINAKIIAEEGRAVDAVLFLDTGGQVPMMLTNSFAMAHPELLKDVPSEPKQAEGVDGGVTRFRIGRVPAIRLGACTVHDPMTAFSLDTYGMGLGGGSFSGEIGLGVFRRFTTIFDYPRGFVIFESPTKGNSPRN